MKIVGVKDVINKPSKKLKFNFGRKLEHFIKHNYTLYKLKVSLKLGVASWYSLKKYSKFAKQDNDHAFYEKAVGDICGVVDFPKTLEAEFIGKGRGENVLNSYRKVKLENDCVFFEKVYKNESDDFFKVKFFYEKACFLLVKNLL